MPRAFDRTILAANLLRLRQERHLTKADVQRATGIDYGGIHAYETGSLLPSLETLAVLSSFYNCSLDALVFVAGCRPARISAENELKWD